MLPPAVDAPVAARPAHAWSLAVEAQVGAAVGIVRELAPVGLATIAVRPASILSLEIGGLFIPTQGLELQGGTVEVGMLAAGAAACLWPYRTPRIDVGGCAGVLAGSIRAEGRGYLVDGGASRPWFAARAAAVAEGPLVGLLGWTAGAGLPFRPSARASGSRERGSPTRRRGSAPCSAPD